MTFVAHLQREVRRLLAEGRILSYEKGEVVVKLKEQEFTEEEALIAIEHCDDLYTATKFLRQECELCTNIMNVTEVRWPIVLILILLSYTCFPDHESAQL
jgi:hypothetical protein